MIEHVPAEIQTDEICKTAVLHDGTLLQYVVNKTAEICRMAVANSPYALKHVVYPGGRFLILKIMFMSESVYLP